VSKVVSILSVVHRVTDVGNILDVLTPKSLRAIGIPEKVEPERAEDTHLGCGFAAHVAGRRPGDPL
jgi:hypothetical protein